MIAVIQKVKTASVMVSQRLISDIKEGIVALVGFEETDTEEDLQWMAKKVAQMRIFPDDSGVLNNSLLDIGGEILIVSQFTLHASTKKGNRPSYVKAAKAIVAKPLYIKFIAYMKLLISSVQTGEFGADMQVSLVNDGPVTIIIDSKNKA